MKKLSTVKLQVRYLLATLVALTGFHCAFSQTPVSGVVKDENGQGMPGVNVVEATTSNGTATDANGKFTINPTQKSSVLTFSFIGYATLQVPIEGRTQLDVVMTPDVVTIEEVVVTALGVEREKRELVYSTQKVNGDEIIRSKESNVINGLAGKVSGVQITSSSGTPGASNRIVIRGVTSINGDNQALIVIDGIPVDNSESTSPTGGAAGAGSSRLSDIDPSIIENINVLKGAAATALYGSAGARGVVMITTKTGNNRKPQITFSSDLSFEKPLLPERQTKYGQGNNGVYFDGETAKISSSWGPLMDTLIVDGQKAKKYDPYDYFKTGVTTNNNITLSGGNDNSSYVVSYSYFNQDGINPNTSFKRNSFFTKYSAKVNKNLTATFQMQYSNSNQKRLPEGYANGPLFVLYGQPVSWNPQPYENPDGSQRLYRYSRNNPYWASENMQNDLTVDRYIPELTLMFKPLPWLTITERVGADMFNESLKYWESPSDMIGTSGRIIDQDVNFRQFNNDIIISAEKEFGDFNLNLMLGNNLFSSYWQTNNITGNGTKIDGYQNVNGAETITAWESHSLRRKVGFYAQANIDYKRTFILSLTGRYDGSSVLSQDKQFYPYGSIGGSFVFTEVLPKSDVLSFGKLRLSYATVGNDNVQPYSLNTPYVSADISGIVFPFQDQPGFLLTATKGNPNLKNERLNESEIGIETKFFENRIGLEASYFYRHVVDGIIPGVAMAPSTGFTGTTVNTAEMKTKGLELLLTAVPVKTDKFSWDMTVNFTRLRNEVVALYPGISQLGRIIVGQPYNIFYGTSYLRNEKGEKIINDAGLPVVGPNAVIGDVNPDWLAGITNTFKYGQLSLSVFVDIKKGGDLLNSVDSYGTFYGTAKITEDRAPKVIEGVRESDGQPNTTPTGAQAWAQYITSIEEFNIQDGTYVKLRNVSLSYDFPTKLLSKTPLEGLTLSVTGRNLWIYSPNFTGADPEVSTWGADNASQGFYAFSVPTSRSINFTIRGKF